MNNLSLRSIFVFMLASVVLLSALACSHLPVSERYQPGADKVFLWRGEAIPLEPGWRYLGEERISVRGEIWDSILTPVDEVRSLVFVREEQDPPAILILSRVAKTSQIEIFRYLGGIKTVVEGLPYRENIYGLEADTTDPEYKRYLDKIRAAGISLAPAYTVRILDRLPVDTALVRIMELTPGKAHDRLPSYGKLYPQERQELLQRRIF